MDIEYHWPKIYETTTATRIGRMCCSPPVSSNMRIADEIVRVVPAAIDAAPSTAYLRCGTTSFLCARA